MPIELMPSHEPAEPINWAEVVEYVQTTGGDTARQIWAKLTEQERPLYMEALKQWSSGKVEQRPDDNMIGLSNGIGLPPEGVLGGLTGLAGRALPVNLSKQSATGSIKSGTNFAGHVGRERGVQLPGRVFHNPPKGSGMRQGPMDEIAAGGPAGEAAKRTAMFGGLNAAAGGFIKPSAQRLLGKEQIQEMIKNAIRLGKQVK